MTILMTGNTGYVGSVLTKELQKKDAKREIKGWDAGFFLDSIDPKTPMPEANIRQCFGDIREPLSYSWTTEAQQLEAVVHLAAISNDPMGKEFEKVTKDINVRSSLEVARLAKTYGARKFVFASSCSLYGAGGDTPRKEDDPLNPLTAYAESKDLMEKGLQTLADHNFQVICLRFATACGASPRIRLDLVLNDFVASALTQGRIEVLSDGSPYRPLIHVQDMVRAIEWAIDFEPENHFLVINVGSDSWNYQIKDLAATVADLLPNTTYSITSDALPDQRSYRVDFSLFESLAPNHQPQVDLKTAVLEIYDHLKQIGFQDPNFRQSSLMRLHHLRSLIATHQINHELFWKDQHWQSRLESEVQEHQKNLNQPN